MIAFIKKILGISDLEYQVRLLQRQNYINPYMNWKKYLTNIMY